ncbi:hypothetical protein HNR62_002260 [Oceanisphaera litoralis]|uniref:hypothetical protein n=1 Tax=Oceanisphaera litoralis TaxID=225144 RepID=UPI0019597E4C|nr:hypothetical protein [Oceanisphaera litoralis]MBM7456374.1 hypothetical protein [Oceanisphaera litoralis]
MKAGREHISSLISQQIAILEFIQPSSGHRVFIFSGTKDIKIQMSSQTTSMVLNRISFGGMFFYRLIFISSTRLNEEERYPDLLEAAPAHIHK